MAFFKCGATVLIDSAERGQVEIVNVLLKAGAKIDAKNKVQEYIMIRHT